MGHGDAGRSVGQQGPSLWCKAPRLFLHPSLTSPRQGRGRAMDPWGREGAAPGAEERWNCSQLSTRGLTPGPEGHKGCL